MPELLWEIGCEELPAIFVAPALAQMAVLFREKFTAARLFSDVPEGTNLVTLGTPRRLVLHATGLAERQPDETVVVKGPAQNIAFDADGRPTKAALGFAQKNGIAADALQIVEGYVQATVTRPGQPAGDIAANLLPKIARELTFQKAMRWGEGKLRFARPIRWILALLNDSIIPFAIEHVDSGRRTRGHRFLSPDEADVPNVAAYFPLMREKSVILDSNERRTSIINQAKSLALDAGGTVQMAEVLLDENVFLTEYPTCVLGRFDPAFLTLPRPVLVTAMRKHQRYFPLVAPDGALMPNFIAVRNGGDQYLDTVRTGFENVLAARFNDAKFFFDLDMQSSLASKIISTKHILFQEKLGTVYEKSLRLGPILQDGKLLIGKNEREGHDLMRAAALCKADLATEMVKELPALQGIIGEDYARRDGEHEAIAVAIAEHYLPKGAGDPLPPSEAGRLLAIADRVDTLTGYVGIGIIPTGTSDPYALRRAAAGLVALLATSDALPPLRALFDAAWLAYAAQEIALTASKETAYASLVTLVTQRLDASLEDKSVRYDIRDAALAAPFRTVFEAESRALALRDLADSDALKSAQAAATRIGNILRFAEKEGILLPPEDPDPSLFSDEMEIMLWAEWQAQRPAYETTITRREWADALQFLANLQPAIDTFFDAVMVMDEDTALRDNRLAMLARLRDAYARFADFDKLVTL